MTQNYGPSRHDDDESRWAQESREGGVGPQGTALILELERLRAAFAHDGRDDLPRRERRLDRDGERLTPRPRAGAKKRGNNKSTLGRVIDVCRFQLGLDKAASIEKKTGSFGGSRTAPPPRRRSPTLVPEGPKPVPRASAAPERPGRGGRHPLPPEPNEAPRFPSWPRSVDTAAVPAEAPRRVEIEPRRQQAARPRIDPPRIEMASPRLDEALPRIALPSPPPGNTLPSVSTAGTKVAKGRVSTLRGGISNGVAFLLNRNASAHLNESGDSLSAGVGRAFENELRTGLRVLIVAVVVIGGWAGFVPLAGAVVAPGNLVVQSNVKTIQHPTGGVVAEIGVKNGSHVQPGQLLVRLDGTQARSSLQVVSKQLDDLRGKIARLTAERDGLPQPEFPPEMTSRSDDPGVKAILASEQSLFNARSTARRSQKDLLQSRVSQLGEEIAGLDAQIKSKVSQIDLITGELTGVQDLYDKRLVPLTRLTTLQRESARIEGERGQLLSSIAETKAKIGEAQLQIVKIDQDFRSDVVKDLGEAQGKEAELVEHGVAAKDLLDRIELRAPTSGVVNQLATHTIGGVIRAGDSIMEIVPDSDDLQVEAHVQPKDIDEVRTGQKALVALSALNARVTPKLVGEVTYVSADTSKDKDPQAAGAFFTVRVMIPEEERRRLGGAQLVSGMPAELFMQTGSHTMLSYLFKPITEQLGRAFVER